MKIIAIIVMSLLIFWGFCGCYVVLTNNLQNTNKTLALQMFDGGLIKIGIAGIIAAILAKK